MGDTMVSRGGKRTRKTTKRGEGKERCGRERRVRRRRELLSPPYVTGEIGGASQMISLTFFSFMSGGPAICGTRVAGCRVGGGWHWGYNDSLWHVYRGTSGYYEFRLAETL